MIRFGIIILFNNYEIIDEIHAIFDELHDFDSSMVIRL